MDLAIHVNFVNLLTNRKQTTMKNFILTLSAIFMTIYSFSQNKELTVGSAQYQEAKKNGTLSNYTIKQPLTHEVYDYSQYKKLKKKGKGDIPSKASGCNCYVDPDSTYTLALGPTDDGSSGLINLPFSFCFYGVR